MNERDQFVWLDHISRRLITDEEEAKAVLAAAPALGLDVHAITERLQADAIKAFASSFDQLVATLAEKRRQILTAAS